jgi:hypothetical protein
MALAAVECVAGGRNVVYFTGRVVRCHRLYCAGPVAAGGRCGQRVSRSQRSACSARRRHRCRTARGRVARGAMQRPCTKRSVGTAQQRWDGPTVRPVMSIGSHCGLSCCAHRPSGYAHTPIAHVNTLGPAASLRRTAKVTRCSRRPRGRIAKRNVQPATRSMHGTYRRSMLSGAFVRSCLLHC